MKHINDTNSRTATVSATNVSACRYRAVAWLRRASAMNCHLKPTNAEVASTPSHAHPGELSAKATLFKVRRIPLWASVITLLATLASVSASAQEISAPPYYIGKGEYVVLGIAYERSRIKSSPPADVRMTSGATGRIVMYTAIDNAGLPPYSSSWIGLEIEGFDTPNGDKARWMLTGLYSPANVAAALAKHFDYPTRKGTTRLGRDGRRVVAVGMLEGQEIIRAELVLKDEPCQHVSGLVHEVTRNSVSGSFQLIKIPTLGNWCAAETATVQITAPSGDPFDDLAPVKVLWGGYFYGGFGWSEPVTPN